MTIVSNGASGRGRLTAQFAEMRPPSRAVGRADFAHSASQMLGGQTRHKDLQVESAA